MLLSPFDHKGKDDKFVPLVGGLLVALILLVGVEIWPDIKLSEQGTILASVKNSWLITKTEVSSFYKLLVQNTEINNLVEKVVNDSNDLKEDIKITKESAGDFIIGVGGFSDTNSSPSLNNLNLALRANVLDLGSLIEGSFFKVKSAVDHEVKGVVRGMNFAYDNSESELSKDATISLSLHPIQTASVISAFEGILQNIDKGFQVFDNFTERMILNIKYYYNQVVEKWLVFLSGEDQSSPEIDIDALRAEIKADILNEIRTEIANLQTKGQSITEPEIFESETGQGVVVLPANSSLLSDEEVKSQLKDMFSDETEISFDQSGQSGVITPIFKDKRGEDFIFLLTPINRNE